MVSDKETASIRRFVSSQLCDDPDLSTLTFGILKRRYLAHVRRDSLSPKAKHFMKRVVKEELMKMQDNEKSGSDLETKKPQNKRKREKESEKVLSGREDGDESRAKKSCGRLSSSTSESEDEESCKTGSEGSDKQEPIKSGSEEKEIKTTPQKTSGKRKQQIDSDDSTEEKMHESEKEESESNPGDSPKKRVKKKAKSTTNAGKTSEEQKTAKTDEEKETDTGGKSEKSHKSDESSDDGEKDEKVLAEKKNNNSDSDSSSLPSLEDTKYSGKENTKDDKKKKKRVKKKEGTKKKESTSTPEADNKAVVRLKRYIALCGVRRNYKKLLDGCRSIGAKVAALKKELEDLGVDGQPSIKKCKKARMEREEAEEIAELDVSNILSAKGRPKRRGVWQEHHKPPSSTYHSTLNSGSDSEQENDTSKGRRRATDWANLKGIISDDADSD